MKKYRIPLPTGITVTKYIYEREDLEKFQTKKLIELIHLSTREFVTRDEDGNVECDWDDCGGWWSTWYNEAELRDILKHRPHIPTKEQRREMIKSIRKKTKKILKYRK